MQYLRMDRSSIIKILTDSPWLHDAEPGLMSALADCVRIRRFPTPKPIYRQGDAGDGVYIVAEGQVKLTSYSKEGARLLMLIGRSGEWFGELSTLDGGPRQQDAVCDGGTVLYHLLDHELEKLGREYPGLWRSLGRLCAAHQRRAFGYVLDLVSLPPDRRVAAVLAVLHNRLRTRELRATQEEIAASVGLSRQTVSAILGRMEENGQIRRGYGTITVLEDLVALVA